MSLNGIDVSNHQSGLDLRAVPFDFVICKATQGTAFVDRSCAGFVETALSMGRATGIYHYAEALTAPQSEARYFYDNTRNWVGRAVLALDWEHFLGYDAAGRPRYNPLFGTGPRAQAWIRSWCDEIKRLTGVEPLVYTGAANLRDVQNIGNRGLWIAQYASNARTGYQATPWNEGKYPCAIRQYSSNGRFDGYAGPLDLDKFYGDRHQWDAYVGKNTSHPDPAGQPAAPSQDDRQRWADTVSRLVDETLAGKYGNGDDRKRQLGAYYQSVQSEVNRRLGVTAKPSADAVARQIVDGQGGWGNEPQRSQRLRSAGYDPAAVQRIVNSLMSVHAAPAKPSIDAVARQIVRGGASNPWGNEPQRSQRLRAAGYDPKTVQRRVNQLMG